MVVIIEEPTARVQNIVQEIKNNKSTGENGITAKIFKE